MKGSLRESARVSNIPLNDIFLIPDHPADMLSIFSSALTLVQVLDNEEYQQVRYSDDFRLSCSKLRLQLIEMAKSVPKEERFQNLRTWAQMAKTIWTSVNETNHLTLVPAL